MQVSLNGLLPTKEQLEAFQKMVPVSFELEEWRDYEENLEWELMTITYATGDVITSKGYTGVWELVALYQKFTRFDDATKLILLEDIFNHWLGVLNDGDLVSMDHEEEDED